MSASIRAAAEEAANLARKGVEWSSWAEWREGRLRAANLTAGVSVEVSSAMPSEAFWVDPSKLKSALAALGPEPEITLRGGGARTRHLDLKKAASSFSIQVLMKAPPGHPGLDDVDPPDVAWAGLTEEELLLLQGMAEIPADSNVGGNSYQLTGIHLSAGLADAANHGLCFRGAVHSLRGLSGMIVPADAFSVPAGAMAGVARAGSRVYVRTGAYTRSSLLLQGEFPIGSANDAFERSKGERYGRGAFDPVHWEALYKQMRATKDTMFRIAVNEGGGLRITSHSPQSEAFTFSGVLPLVEGTWDGPPPAPAGFRGDLLDRVIRVATGAKTDAVSIQFDGVNPMFVHSQHGASAMVLPVHLPA